MSEELEFFRRPEPITQCDETVECDVAVVGAGSPGVPCAIRAGELGMKVAVLQKESYASACGNFGAGILLDKSDPEQVEACVSLLVAGVGLPREAGRPRNLGEEFRSRRLLDGRPREESGLPGGRYGNHAA